MRAGAVKYLQELGWAVTVVVPNYNSDKVVDSNNVLMIPFPTRYNARKSAFFQRIGWYEDYLDKWVLSASDFLKCKITSHDIIIATCGGELGMIKLGHIIKNKVGCKFVINFRDPLDFGYMNGFRKSNVLHVNREHLQEKYTKNSDLILTSSNIYLSALKKRFPNISPVLHNNYFGYLDSFNIDFFQKKRSDNLRIAYAGTMSEAQCPEVLYDVLKSINEEEVEIFYIGDIDKYKPLKRINDENVHFIDFMDRDRFVKFMCENIDVGFVSLVNKYYGACVPSKIYEYINLGIPILGVLPHGDGMNIVNTNKYGKVVTYENRSELPSIISGLKDPIVRSRYRERIISDRDSWHMKNRILEVHQLLKDIV
ncbi:glycosyl transferase family 1 [Salinivibrio proteolyticus]|uniref:glycosyl transferase family 1 n=1 Tax=Salinivibrio proteolyticus TaxID=334715 RepID=UPI0010564A3C|nr:glycosyl transferase family 1 [Salinivibrio proteolyticus]